MADQTPRLADYLKYNNPNVNLVRTGNVGDEYVDRNDYLPVVHGIITLLEIPSERFGVQIEGFTEITNEEFQIKGYIGTNEILVYYPSGIIMFNSAQYEKSFMVKYKGRGVILLSSDRVYLMYQKDPNVLVTLTDFANEIKSNLKIMSERIIKYEQVAEYTLDIAEKARKATDQAIDATNEALDAKQQALDAARSTEMNFLTPLIKKEDLEVFYPNPNNGDRVMILSTGDVYRYDAIKTRSWQLIDNLTKYLIPNVTEEYDGILSKYDYRKLMKKPFEFSLGKVTQGGVHDNLAKVPYEGWLNKCYAYMNNNLSDTPIEIGVEMISFENFKILHDGINEDKEGNPIQKTGWINIFEENILILPNQAYGEGVIDPDYQNVDANTLYRLNFKQFDNKMGGITIFWDYWIKKPVIWGDYQFEN